MAAIDDRWGDLMSFNPKKNFKGLFGNYADINPYGNMNPDQQALSKALGPRLTAIAAAGPQKYTGQLSAPISTAEQDIVDKYNALNTTNSARLSALSNTDEATFNKQFQEEIADPTWADFKSNVQPLIDESLPSFSTARGVVTGRYGNQLAGDIMTTRFNAREAMKNRALSAIQASGPAAESAAKIAAIPRGIQQAGLDREYSDYVQGNADYAKSINTMMQFLGLDTGTYEQDSSIDRLLALLGTGAKMYGAMQGQTGGTA